jgi:hypothetical protein
MKHTCPFCYEEVDVLKHVGQCIPKDEPDFSDEPVPKATDEEMVNQALKLFEHMFEAQLGRKPTKKILDAKRLDIQRNLIELKKRGMI